MRKPLNARSTQFVKIQTSARATLGANPASSASRHPIRRPFSLAHGVSLSTRNCGSLRTGQTHPLRVNAPTRVKHTTAAARLWCSPCQKSLGAGGARNDSPRGRRRRVFHRGRPHGTWTGQCEHAFPIGMGPSDGTVSGCRNRKEAMTTRNLIPLWAFPTRCCGVSD